MAKDISYLLLNEAKKTGEAEVLSRRTGALALVRYGFSLKQGRLRRR